MLPDTLHLDLANMLRDPGTLRVLRHWLADSGVMHHGLQSEYAQGRRSMGMTILQSIKDVEPSVLPDIL